MEKNITKKSLVKDIQNILRKCDKQICDDYSNYDFTLRTKLVKNTDGIKWVSLRSVKMMNKVYPIYSKNININILTNIKNILDMMRNTCVVMKVTYTYRHC